MTQNWFGKDKATIIFVLVLLIGTAAGWLLYASFGHPLVRSIYEGGSFEILNRIVIGQVSHPLEYYYKLADKIFIRLNVIVIFSFIYLFSIWSQRPIPKKWFLCLIVIFSLCQIGTFFDFKDMDGLLIFDDHPKNYSIAVENANLLLKYGSPFGFNHNFQGGIPAFYVRSCFLELVPFSLLLRERLSYQAMLISFIVLIPISIFLLVLELTKNEDIARLVSFISTFQLWLWLRLHCGMTTTVVALPLSFLSVFFFLKYLYHKRYPLSPLLLFSGLLVYTQPVVFLITCLSFAIIFTYKLFTQRQFLADFKKIIYFGLLGSVMSLPFWYYLLSYRAFLRSSSLYLGQNLPIFLNIKDIASLKNPLFLSMPFLAAFYFCVLSPKQRPILRNAMAFSLLILLLQSLKEMPHTDIFAKTVDWFFMPYIAVFNLSLFMLLGIKRAARVWGVIILLSIILIQYPVSKLYLKTVNSTSEIDSGIKAFVAPGDYVLFENCAHKNPICPGAKCEKASYGYGHWLTYLQKELGVRFFSQMGDDAHPYNNLRHMYITDGLYKGRPLGEDDGEEFTSLLRSWGVNKACVWSSTAKGFFDKNGNFKLLGESERYTCYAATYPILPEVRLGKHGRGRIVEETPFSFTVCLQGISEKQTVTINKNYFDFWSAYDERGDKIPLRGCNQKICFDTENNGCFFFKCRKNIPLNLISLLALALALASDISRHIPVSRHKHI